MSRTDTAFLKSHSEWESIIEKGAKIAQDAIVVEKGATEYGRLVLSMMLKVAKKYSQYLLIFYLYIHIFSFITCYLSFHSTGTSN